MTNSKTRRDQQRVLARMRTLSLDPARGRRTSFWLEGIRNFLSACDARFDFEAIVYSPILLKSALVEMHIRRLRAAGALTYRIRPEQFRALSRAERASGIGALARTRWLPLARTCASAGLCWIVVEDLRAAGNL